ncbi:MAG: DUF4157 domain-containing protein [Cyanobacteriota bacterium]|nr:DUF4157 domain-containing protein [Cyanobacteriota bacterium]
MKERVQQYKTKAVPPSHPHPQQNEGERSAEQPRRPGVRPEGITTADLSRAPTDAQLNSGIPQLQPSGLARRIAPHRHAQPPAPTDAQLNSGIPQLQPSGLARRIAPHRHAQPPNPTDAPSSGKPIVRLQDDERETQEINPKADTPESQLTSPEEINLKADTSAREETHLSSSEKIQAQLQPEEQQEQSANGTIQRLCSECETELAEKGENPPIQTQLKIGQPGDKYEQEADAKAAEVMKMEDPAASSEVEEESSENAIQKQPLAETITPLVQRKENPESGKSPNIEQQLGRGGGQPLGQETRSFMESRFGADFSGVRVHTDSNAVQMNKDLGAQAFAHGQDIYYGKGRSPGKNKLTAHELTHTIQQSGGKIQQGQKNNGKVNQSEKEETGRLGLEDDLATAKGESTQSQGHGKQVGGGYSGGGGAGESVGSSPGSLELRFKPVVLGAHHAFIILRQPSDENGNGEEHYYRGGPSRNGPDWGWIRTEHGVYTPETTDWTTNPSGQIFIERVYSQAQWREFDSALTRTMDNIQSERIKYGLPTGHGCGSGANSNSTAYQGIRELGFFPPAPPVKAPCWEINPFDAVRYQATLSEPQSAETAMTNPTPATTVNENALITQS